MASDTKRPMGPSATRAAVKAREAETRRDAQQPAAYDEAERYEVLAQVLGYHPAALRLMYRRLRRSEARGTGGTRDLIDYLRQTVRDKAIRMSINLAAAPPERVLMNDPKLDPRDGVLADPQFEAGRQAAERDALARVGQLTPALEESYRARINALAKTPTRTPEQAQAAWAPIGAKMRADGEKKRKALEAAGR